MAQISIDFDLVSRFAMLHRDVGASLNSHRHVFRTDANHIDQVVAAFRLARPVEPFAAAMSEADTRAAKAAETLANTSMRVLNHVRTNQAADTDFSWGAASQAAFALLTVPFGLSAARAASGLFSRTMTTRRPSHVTSAEQSHDLLASANRATSQKLDGADRPWDGLYGVKDFYEAKADAGNKYQCVSWAWVRIRELGYRGINISVGRSGHVGTSGADMAFDLAHRDGRELDIEPRLGAVVSTPGPTTDGHVFVVEEVVLDSSGRVVRARFSEMNSEGNVRPGDFRHDQWIQRAGDKFQRVYVDTNGQRVVADVEIYNPNYPPGSAGYRGASSSSQP